MTRRLDCLDLGGEKHTRQICLDKGDRDLVAAAGKTGLAWRRAGDQGIPGGFGGIPLWGTPGYSSPGSDSYLNVMITLATSTISLAYQHVIFQIHDNWMRLSWACSRAMWVLTEVITAHVRGNHCACQRLMSGGPHDQHPEPKTPNNKINTVTVVGRFRCTFVAWQHFSWPETCKLELFSMSSTVTISQSQSQSHAHEAGVGRLGFKITWLVTWPK